MSGSYGGDAHHAKRRSYKMNDRPPSMTIGHNDHGGNSSRTLMNYYDDEEEEYSRHNTKSTRFSSKGRGRNKMSRGFEFDEEHAQTPHGQHSHPQSTRSSRGWVRGQHVQRESASSSRQVSGQLSNMQPLVLQEKDVAHGSTQGSGSR